MRAIRRQVLVILLSIGLLLSLLMLIAFDGFFNQSPPEMVTLREIQMAAPPPPPPPTPVNDARRPIDPVLELEVLAPNSPVTLLNMELDLSIPLGQLSEQGPGTWDDDLSIDWGELNFSQADAVPILLNSPIQRFPRSFLRKGVKNFEVNLMIVVDVDGHSYLYKVLENPYPEINASLEDYVSRMRYTPATFGGVVGKGVFAKLVEIRL